MPKALAACTGSREKKKETKLGMLVKKSEDFAEWYTQVCTVSEMISYYDVSGMSLAPPHCSRQPYLDPAKNLPAPP